MESITHVPSDFVEIIPVFDGDSRLLSLFIKKCEYILNTFKGSPTQNQYIFHIVTSKLRGEAAKIVGERDHIRDWDQLKSLLIQYFGDPRTEECLAMELENLKINVGESYLEFTHRIQRLRSILYSKVNDNHVEHQIQLAKQNIYSNSSLNVFLYNLPIHLVRLVRLRNALTLEEALKIVLEEENFQLVYRSKNTQFNKFNNNNYRHFRSNGFSSNNFNNPMPVSSQNHFTPSSFHSRQHSFNKIPLRNFNNFNNNVSRSPGMQSQHSRNNGFSPMQRLQDNAPHVRQFESPGTVTPSRNNTDVTMRTASTRRSNQTYNPLNYTNYRQQGDNFEPHFEQSQENFHMGASNIEKE